MIIHALKIVVIGIVLGTSVSVGIDTVKPQHLPLKVTPTTTQTTPETTVAPDPTPTVDPAPIPTPVETTKVVLDVSGDQNTPVNRDDPVTHYRGLSYMVDSLSSWTLDFTWDCSTIWTGNEHMSSLIPSISIEDANNGIVSYVWNNPDHLLSGTVHYREGELSGPTTRVNLLAGIPCTWHLVATQLYYQPQG